ncbi:MAG: ABC transporter permease subunit [Desulfobacterales bacterium]|nr:MAG: ABC transporter permease subunit [Desulfobacterales bacterium]
MIGLARKIVAGGVVAAVILPFIPLIMWSFSNRWFYPDLWPRPWGTRAWEYVLGIAGSQITAALGRSLWVAAVTAVMAVVVGTPAGRALGLYDFKGKDLVSVLLTLPVIVPPLCVAMGLHLWFIKLGLAETFGGVVLVHLTFCLPYTVFVMWGVFSNYNLDFEDQARSLGASTLQVMYRVMLPLTFSGIVVAGLFAFLLSWSQYLSTLIIGGGKITTLPILLFALMGSGDRPVAASVSIVFVVPAFLALLLSARHLGRRSITGVR